MKPAFFEPRPAIFLKSQRSYTFWQTAAAVTGATGVLLFAFLPLMFLPEGSGDFVLALPTAVIGTVGASLLVSLTVIPFVASRLLKPPAAGGNRLLRAITGGIERFYAPVLHRALDRPRGYFWGAMALCLGAFALVPVLGFSLFPAAETPYFLVRVETPEGSSLASTDRAVRDVSAILKTEDAVVDRLENVGRGNPQIFYNIFARDERARYGDVFVTLRQWGVIDGPRLLARLRAKLNDYRRFRQWPPDRCANPDPRHGARPLRS